MGRETSGRGAPAQGTAAGPGRARQHGDARRDGAQQQARQQALRQARRPWALPCAALLLLACAQGPATALGPGGEADGGVPPAADAGSASDGHGSGSGSGTGTDGGVGPACAGGAPAPQPGEGGLPASEREARGLYGCTPVALEGRVVAPDGSPVAGAILVVHGKWGRTDAEGRFAFPALPRRNALLEVEAPGFRSAAVPLHLRRALAEARAPEAEVVLAPEQPGVARLLFAGDVMLGRRYLDPRGEAPPDRVPPPLPGARVSAADPLSGSRTALAFVRPLLGDADLTAVNLESAVTDDPEGAHPGRERPILTLPGSLPALLEAGVGYAGLGNERVSDFLEPGLRDTLRHLDAAGLGRSGAGRDADEAYRPWTTSLAGRGFSLLSVSSIADDDAGPEFDGMAGAATAGAADVRDRARLRAALGAERAAGRVPVVLLHAGAEFASRPTPGAVDHAREAARAGAALVVGHHPRVPQGLAWAPGGVLVAYSLGALLYDAERPEARVGLLADVHLRGRTLAGAGLLPVLLEEDLLPRPLGGALADRELRHLGALSQEGGVLLLPRTGRAEVALPGAPAPAPLERTVDVPLTVPARGWAVADLRGLLAPGESLARARLEAAPEGRLVAGRDVLRHGEFEDYDVDADVGEATGWDTGDTPGFVCQEAPRGGAGALCLWGLAGARGGSQAVTRERLRLPGEADGRPNRWLTLTGWWRGAGAGAARVEAVWEPVEGAGAPLGVQPVAERPGGTFPWAPFEADLQAPAARAALRVRLAQAPLPPGAPEDGVLAFDDLALVAWEEAGARGQPLQARATPHARDFLRVEAPPGPHTLRLTLRRHPLPQAPR
jgi:hypothetical protein